MRRWTILLIPHDTEQPRSYAVSERAVRRAVGGAAVLALTVIGGVAATAYQVARRGGLARVAQADSAAASSDERAVDSLRATVEALNGALDTIRATDAMLAQVAGVAPPDSATLARRAALERTKASADSLLRGASAVAGRLGALADSARRRGVVPANRASEPTRSAMPARGRQD